MPTPLRFREHRTTEAVCAESETLFGIAILFQIPANKSNPRRGGIVRTFGPELLLLRFWLRFRLLRFYAFEDIRMTHSSMVTPTFEFVNKLLPIGVHSGTDY